MNGNTYGMKTNYKRRGFALIELPLVLFILALIGLAVVVAVRLLAGPVSWYWWPIGFITLPAIFMAWAVLLGISDDFHPKRKSN